MYRHMYTVSNLCPVSFSSLTSLYLLSTLVIPSYHETRDSTDHWITVSSYWRSIQSNRQHSSLPLYMPSALIVYRWQRSVIFPAWYNSLHLHNWWTKHHKHLCNATMVACAPCGWYVISQSPLCLFASQLLFCPPVTLTAVDLCVALLRLVRPHDLVPSRWTSFQWELGRST